MRVQQFLSHIRRWARLHDANDARLLDAFFEQKDEEAFTLLVRRHGPMVLGVCRRLLPVAEDAEDAFQATFLVLVRKGRRLPAGTMLGAWLHGVAWRTAKKAQTMLAKRRQRTAEERVEPTQPPAATVEQKDLRRVLDEEIARLPAPVRAAVIACYLEGNSKSQAARLLNWPEGTVATRLAWARKQLGRRLTRRGVTLGSGLAAGEWGLTRVAEAVGPTLMHQTTAAAAQALAGPWAATAAISTTVFQLAEGVLASMKTLSAKSLVILTTAGLAFGGGAGWWGWGQGTAAAPAPAPTPAVKSQQDPVRQPDQAPEDFAEKLQGTWIVEKVDVQPPNTKEWKEATRPSGYLRFEGNVTGSVSFAYMDEFISATAGSFNARYKVSQNPADQSLLITASQLRGPALPTVESKPLVAQFANGRLVLVVPTQNSWLSTGTGASLPYIRITARRANDHEELEGGWTKLEQNEVTNEVMRELSLIFRNSKYVAVERLTRQGKAIETPPAPYRLRVWRELAEAPGERVKALILECTDSTGFFVSKFVRVPAVRDPISNENRIIAAYRIENGVLLLAAYTDEARQRGEQIPVPMPKTEAEAEKMGAVLHRFHRSYYRPRRPNDTVVEPFRATTPATRPATPATDTFPAMSPEARELTEKIRATAKAAYEQFETRFALGSSIPLDNLYLITYSRAWCDAELELATNSAERLLALEAQVARMHGVEEKNRQRLNAGQIPAADVLPLTHARLLAERALLLEQQRSR